MGCHFFPVSMNTSCDRIVLESDLFKPRNHLQFCIKVIFLTEGRYPGDVLAAL